MFFDGKKKAVSQTRVRIEHAIGSMKNFNIIGEKDRISFYGQCNSELKLTYKFLFSFHQQMVL